MKQYFKLSDFLRATTSKGWKKFDVPDRNTLDSIVSGHFVPVNSIRIACKLAIQVTSCFRPEQHELARGRDGTSQHTFPDHGFENKLGATDFTYWYDRHKSLSNFLKLCDEAQKHFTRVCFYPQEEFLHGDYKSLEKGYFVAEYAYDDESQSWVVSGWQSCANKKAWMIKIEDEYKRFHK